MAVDVEHLKSTIDLRDLAGRFTTLRRESTSELSGPCPRCGGEDRFHVTANMAFCRQCWPLEKFPPAHDAIGFVQWLGLAADFRAAVDYLGGGRYVSLPTRPRAPDPRPAAARWQDHDWQDAAWHELAEAQARLASPAGAPGAEYLRGRGIEPETWAVWGLGYRPDVWDPKLRARRPAILIPWRREKITALKYRFLAVPDGGLRYVSKAGGQCIAFGLHMAGAHFATLWLIEGELNALSLWQALGAAGCVNFDVVSFGGESRATHLDPVVKAWAGRYRQVIIWADNPERAAAAMAALPGAFGLRSPVVDGEKLDANELLRLGGLTEFARAAWARFDQDPAYIGRTRAELE